MAIPNVKPLDRERTFAIEELFFSTTDAKGIIRYGNKVFSRVAGYELEKLIGEPHNIIRHPDMPRAVFQLLWDTIQADRPIVAYVKNMAKDGSYYWVLASVLPCKGGYLSIRIKPSSPIFDVVKAVYADVLATERAVEADGEPNALKRGIQAGLARTLELLKSKGFNSYDEFMWAIFSTEMMSRRQAIEANDKPDKKASTSFSNGAKRSDTPAIDANHKLRGLLETCKSLDNHLNTLFGNVGNFENLNKQLLHKSTFILKLAESLRRFSLNAVVEACRLQDTGAALTVVAETMGRSSNEGSAAVKQLTTSIASLSSSLGELTFDLIVPKLQVEMICVFVKELLDEHTAATEQSSQSEKNDCAIREHIELLVDTLLVRLKKISPLLNMLNSDLNAMNQQIADLQRFVKALRFIQFSGTVEAARCEDAKSFALIFDEALKQIDEAHNELAKFAEIVSTNLQQTKTFEAVNRNINSESEGLQTLI